MIPYGAYIPIFTAVSVTANPLMSGMDKSSPISAASYSILQFLQRFPVDRVALDHLKSTEFIKRFAAYWIPLPFVGE